MQLNAAIAHPCNASTVRSDKHGATVFAYECAKQFENTFRRGVIQITRRFVREQHGRAVAQCPRDCDPLLFAS